MKAVDWTVWGLPKPVEEFRFDPERRYRLDWSWIEGQVAVEQNGGVWSRGAHGRGVGITRDYEKLNLAQLRGWAVGQFTPAQVRSGEAAQWVREMLERRTRLA